jgi:hypothetical protein
MTAPAQWLEAVVPVGGRPTAVCYNPANGQVYCTSQGGPIVAVIDGATNQRLGEIGMNAFPNDMAWNPVENRVYVVNSESSCVSVLRDSAAAVEERSTPYATHSVPAATVVRGVLRVGDGRRQTVGRAGLLDISGRKVLDLKAGDNDVSRLAPGVYFVRAEQHVVRVAVVR